MVIMIIHSVEIFVKQTKIKIPNLLGNPYQFASFLASKRSWSKKYERLKNQIFFYHKLKL